MVGLVIATHGDLSEALLRSMEMIIGAQPRVTALSLQLSDPVEEATARIAAAIESGDEGDGVLILTDMFGGTPSNLCLALMGGSRSVEVVSGVSLPMVLKAVQARRENGLDATAALVKKHGRGAILVAGDVLAGRER